MLTEATKEQGTLPGTVSFDRILLWEGTVALFPQSWRLRDKSPTEMPSGFEAISCNSSGKEQWL